LGSDVTGVTRNYLVSDLTAFIKASGLSFKHHQNNASDTWTITHNLDLTDYLPNITIKLSGGVQVNNIQALGLVTYIDKDNLKINLLNAESGYAYIST
jgi:hypothetical protein